MAKVSPEAESKTDIEAPNPQGWTAAATLEKLLTEQELSDYQALGGTPEAVAASVGCADVTKGLSGDASDVTQRIEFFGGNFFEEKKMTTYIELLVEGLKDYTIIMLIACAIISLIVEVAVPENCDEDDEESGHRRLSGCGGSVIHKILEPIAIIVTVAVVLNVAAMMDYNKERMFAGLSKELEGSNKKIVIRNGKSVEVTDRDIVVGDIVQFNAHMLATIPADGLLISGDGVKINESALTGEPEPIAKNAERPYILSGTEVKFGSGTFLVTAVGARSTAGRIKAAVYQNDGSDEQSPLFQKLDKLAMDIGKLGMVVATICLVASCVNGFLIGDKAPVEDLLEYVINAITVLVVAVPEGLPLAVTLSLAVSSYQMMADKNLVKHLDACETMGSATTICSDKTGTLTANRMTVRGAWLCSEMFEPDPNAERIGKRITAKMNPAVCDLLGNLIAVDTMNESFLIDNDDAVGGADFKGNPTECALLLMSREMGLEYEAIRKATPGRNPETAAQGKAFMFQSARKMMSWAVPKPDGGFRIYCKGASEIVLARCVNVMAPAGNGSTTPLTDETVQALQHDVISLFASEAMRTIGVAYRDFPAQPDWDACHATVLNSDGSPAFDAECDLTLLGVLGIEDPLRDEVPGAIEKCYTAGIDVRMVTGDNLETAVAIASRCGILKAEHYDGDFSNPRTRTLKADRAMTGKDFRRRVYTPPDEAGNQIFIQEEFDKIWPRLRVLARSSPEDKLTLATGLNKSTLCDDAPTVAALKKEGITIFPDRQVIAMTGDGTNDAPALKKADVGFAMGIAGTQIAKDAADIIVLDDNFASIVTAANWGRNVYDAISKFLQFQLTVNISALVCTVIGAFMERVPIKAVQMLWVNLIMDSLASLALATEPPNPEQLKRPPVNRRAQMITPRMWHSMIGHAIYQVFWILILMFNHQMLFPDVPDGVKWEEEPENSNNNKSSRHYTIIFNTFVLMQLFNEINSRKLFGEFNVFEGILDNPYFVTIMVVTFFLQVIMVQFFGSFMSCYNGGLTLEHWIICLAIGAGELVWGQVINLFASVSMKHWVKVSNSRVERHRRTVGRLSSHGSGSSSTRFENLP